MPGIFLVYILLVSRHSISGLEILPTEIAFMDKPIEMGLNMKPELVFPLGYLPAHFTLPQHVI